MKHFTPIPLLIMLALGAQTTATAQDVFAIPLQRGWNLISAPIIPENADIEVIFRDVVERDNLFLCINENGRFYIPQYDFNNIPNWDFHKSYWVKVIEADILIITGERVDPETPIQLRRGWNMVAYFPEQRLHARGAFWNIRRQLMLAKNGRGRFFIYNIQFLELWLERGQGYQVKVSENVELVWAQE